MPTPARRRSRAPVRPPRLGKPGEPIPEKNEYGTNPSPLRTKKAQLEFGEQAAVVHVLKRMDIPFAGVLNQHVQTRHQQAIATQHEGLQPGFPDMLIFRSPPAWPALKGVALEMKQRYGKMSDLAPEQVKWLDKLAKEGWATLVGFGSDDALYKLQALGFFPDMGVTLPPHRPRDVFLMWADMIHKHGDPAVEPPQRLLEAFQSVVQEDEP